MPTPDVLPVPPLDLPGWRGLDAWRDASGRVRRRAEIVVPTPPACPACGGPARAHGTQTQTIRDRPPGPDAEAETIEFRRPRRRCGRACGVLSVPVPGQSGSHPKLTARLVDHVAAELRSGRPASEVARSVGLSGSTVAAIGDDAGVPRGRAGRPRKVAL